jgi:transcriptional regulator with XRE-family HTH domain
MTKLQLTAVNALRKLGQDISDARKRRRIPMALLAERAGILAATLSKIEKGAHTVSMGAYASVLSSLGLIDRLRDLADTNYDTVGRTLEEERLPKRIRLKKSHTPRSKGTDNA